MKTKRFLSMLLCAALALTLLLVTTAYAADTWDGTAATSFAGGDGSTGDPYQIASGAQLAYLAQQVNGGTSYASAYFVLTDDVNLNNIAWVPIGSSNFNPFAGSLDGGGHSVTGLNVNVMDRAGLFGYTASGSTIKNLSVSGTVTASYNFAGGVVAVNWSGSVIENCTFEGTVTSSDEFAGGITGSNLGTVENCAFEGSVEARSNAGGITSINDGTVRDCRSAGSVTSVQSYAGGIAGFNSNLNALCILQDCYNTADISGPISGGVVGDSYNGVTVNCYNAGSVTGNELSGGVVGLNEYSTVQNCYNAGSISAPVSGGVVGKNYGYFSIIENCYNAGSVTGSTDSGGVAGLNEFSATIRNCYWYGSDGNGIGNFTDGTKSGIGRFSDAGGALTATDGTSLNYGDDLLAALRAWISDQAEPSDYLDWTALDGVNSGFPVFAVSAAPSASIDYAAEKLTSLDAGARYIIGGAALTAASGGTVDIDSAWMGTTVDIARRSGIGYSYPQSLPIPPRPPVPQGVTAVQSAAPGGTGGLSGVSSLMEYSADGTTWTPCADGGVSGLAPGTYSVRYKATSSTFASDAAQATVHAVYALSYNLNGGTASNPSSYCAPDLPLTLNNPANPGYAFAGWSGDGITGRAMTVSIPIGSSGDREYTAHWEEITGLPDAFTMYTGGRVTWNPQPGGGTWDWDEEYFSASFNSPATFTALKAGTSTITYTVNGGSKSVTVTIQQAELPATGQDVTPLWILGVLAALSGAAGVAAKRSGNTSG